MNKLNLKKIQTIILVILIAAWVILAIGRTIFNYTKIYTEELEWVGLSTEDKRSKIFGDVYAFLKIIDEKPDKSLKISIITDDVRVRYFNIYVLYPRKTEVIEYVTNSPLIRSQLYTDVYVFSKSKLDFENINKYLSFNGYVLVKVYNFDKSYGGVFIK